MQPVRQGLPPEGHPRPAHPDAPGRPALLLPDAQLPAALRHRARGQEAHRQPHEPARGEGPAQQRRRQARCKRHRQRHAAARPHPLGRRQARDLLPAVLRAHLQPPAGLGALLGRQRRPDAPRLRARVQTAQRTPSPVTNGRLAARPLHWLGYPPTPPDFAL